MYIHVHVYLTWNESFTGHECTIYIRIYTCACACVSTCTFTCTYTTYSGTKWYYLHVHVNQGKVPLLERCLIGRKENVWSCVPIREMSSIMITDRCPLHVYKHIHVHAHTVCTYMYVHECTCTCICTYCTCACTLKFLHVNYMHIHVQYTYTCTRTTYNVHVYYGSYSITLDASHHFRVTRRQGQCTHWGGVVGAERSPERASPLWSLLPLVMLRPFCWQLLTRRILPNGGSFCAEL